MLTSEQILKRFKAIMGVGEVDDWSRYDNLTMEEQEAVTAKMRFLGEAFNQKIKALDTTTTSVSWEEIDVIAEKLWKESLGKRME